MAVPEGPTDKRYIGNGVTKTFTIPFLLLAATDLDVFIDGVEISSGFTVTNVGYPTSTLTFAVAPTDQADIYLQLDVPFERLNDYQENGDFLSSTVNRDFDRIWQALKQLLRWASRSLRLGYFDVDGRGWYQAKGNGIRDLGDPINPQDAVTKKYADELTVDTTHYTDTQMLRAVRTVNGETLNQLPPASSRANKVMGFDAAGQPIGILPASGSGTELAIDLANPVNPSKGGGMVGLSYGGTVANALQHVVPLAPTSAAVFAAFEYGRIHGLSVEIPDWEFTGPGFTYNHSVSMTLRPNAYLNFDLEITGRMAMKSNSVTLVGDFPAFPAGTTIFAGNFSAYSLGDVVMIELSVGGSPTFNEAGIDFAVVQTADASQLVLTTGTRLAYRDPTISRLSNASRHVGTIGRDSISIPGDYTAQFAAGDVLRIENIDGTDGVEGSAFYFELSKVSEISSVQITLETRTIQKYVNPWLAKADMIRGVKIAGGRIKRLTIRHVESCSLFALDVDRAIYGSWYRYQVIGGIRRGLQEPSTSNATWLFNGSMSDIYCGGSLSSTDNAAFKVMSCPNMQLLNISGGNTKATAQGNYGVFIDFFFTPYRIWNENLQAENIRGETPNGGSDRGVWMTGVRNGDLEITGGHVFLQSLVDVAAEVRCAEKQLEIADIVRSTVRGGCKFAVWKGGVDSSLDVTVRDTLGINFGRNFWATGGSKNPETGAVYSIGSNNEFNVNNFSVNSADITLFIQSQDFPLVGAGCRDKSGLAKSIEFGASVTNMRMAPNFLRNEIPASNSWVSARVKGYLNFDGNYQDGGFIMDNNYVFAASGKLRIHTVRPTSSGVGVVVGSQT